jgi:hypothetical protein
METNTQNGPVFLPVGLHTDPRHHVPAPANISSVKGAETSAIRKIAKTVSSHAEVQFSGRFGSDPAVLIPQRREMGRPIPI